ncbi:hypothetical protein QOT17_006805 [Balamuthia mandrillaris]
MIEASVFRYAWRILGGVCMLTVLAVCGFGFTLTDSGWSYSEGCHYGWLRGSCDGEVVELDGKAKESGIVAITTSSVSIALVGLALLFQNCGGFYRKQPFALILISLAWFIHTVSAIVFFALVLSIWKDGGQQPRVGWFGWIWMATGCLVLLVGRWAASREFLRVQKKDFIIPAIVNESSCLLSAAHNKRTTKTFCGDELVEKGKTVAEKKKKLLDIESAIVVEMNEEILTDSDEDRI